MAKWLNDGRTASALEHQFRPIKAAAKNASCNSPSTAEKFGDGTTGSTPKKTRAPRNPSKKTPKKTALSSNEEGDDDSDLEMNTPSKKSSPVKKESMNKVKGGRVEKKNGTPARAAKNTVKSYIDSDDEEYDDELIIKDEDTNAYDFGRAADGDEDMLGGGGGGFLGHGHGNGRGNGSGGFVEEENDFFDSES
ncbi:hypothetical protein sscle_01g004340 [Sclerotinia sclerotiorum 1980 UF-70]|uniref:Uncharacterized protein n=1 Tax=Sclerotinia sclerotiorum (strain ATCC 18683 / 1980 / Ss-1) TaxID=665079 RepID=A0A1D9PSH9_SCLS1|nr:hypothetical protein sscle_01g004340 [Sclerotinia sclerotiorum 1980 UF-70]